MKRGRSSAATANNTNQINNTNNSIMQHENKQPNPDTNANIDSINNKDNDNNNNKRGKSDSSKSGIISNNSSCSTVLCSNSNYILEGGIQYLSGFGGYFQSESILGAIPQGQTNPQHCQYNLYAELLSGTSFTTPRLNNQRTWCYRIKPTAGHKPFKQISDKNNLLVNSEYIISDYSNSNPNVHTDPQQMRWKPFPLVNPVNNNPKSKSIDFLQGLYSICGAGSPELKSGLAIHMYSFNTSMNNKAFVNSDGDLLIVPQEKTLLIRTEFGELHVSPGWICVIPRGITISINQIESELGHSTRGYVLESYSGHHFRLPELGPIGSNGLAQPRDFLYPTATYENIDDTRYTVIQKFVGSFYSYQRENSSPFDVVGWHGNYLPYMYDLNKFVPAGAVRIDHLDPSIFTVLTVPTSDIGVAACDFVIFPPRWAVQENTFRPPYYHRNCMSEFMGNICGRYEAKPEGFLPGGASLHSIMIGHGPDSDTFDHGTDTSKPLQPQRLSDESLSFMFESTYLFRITDFALNKQGKPDADYWKCWAPLKNNFHIPDNNDSNNHNNQTNNNQ